MQTAIISLFEERLAINLDNDGRFPGTSRIRLFSKSEIDDFLTALSPQLEKYFSD